MLLTSAMLLLTLPGAAGAATTPGGPVLAARMTACTTGAQPGARAATFTASMPAVRGSVRLGMRFRLLQRRGTRGRYRLVAVPEWAAEVRSDPGRPGLIFTKRVEGLLAPAAYKAVVRFRWYGAKGTVLRQVTRVTAACRQPDPRPDLRFGGLTARPAEDGTAVYEVIVRNDGRSPADTFAVELTIGDLIQAPFMLGPLAPGTRERGHVTGPRCRPGETVRVDIDADGAVDEAQELDDVVERPCPFLT